MAVLSPTNWLQMVQSPKDTAFADLIDPDLEEYVPALDSGSRADVYAKCEELNLISRATRTSPFVIGELFHQCHKR